MATMPRNRRGFTFDPGGPMTGITPLNDQQDSNTAQPKTEQPTFYNAPQQYTTALSITIHLDERQSRRYEMKPIFSNPTYDAPYNHLNNPSQPDPMTQMTYLNSISPIHSSYTHLHLTIPTLIIQPHLDTPNDPTSLTTLKSYQRTNTIPHLLTGNLYITMSSTSQSQTTDDPTHPRRSGPRKRIACMSAPIPTPHTSVPPTESTPTTHSPKASDPMLPSIDKPQHGTQPKTLSNDNPQKLNTSKSQFDSQTQTQQKRRVQPKSYPEWDLPTDSKTLAEFHELEKQTRLSNTDATQSTKSTTSNSTISTTLPMNTNSATTASTPSPPTSRDPPPKTMKITHITMMAPPQMQAIPIINSPLIQIVQTTMTTSLNRPTSHIYQEPTDTTTPTITIYDITMNRSQKLYTTTISRPAMDAFVTLSQSYFPEVKPIIPYDPTQPLSLDHISSANEDGLQKIEMFLPIEITPTTSGVMIFKIQ